MADYMVARVQLITTIWRKLSGADKDKVRASPTVPEGVESKLTPHQQDEI